MAKAEQTKPKQSNPPPKVRQEQDPDDAPREPLDPKTLVKVNFVHARFYRRAENFRTDYFLFQIEKPLDEAAKFLKPLLLMDSRELDTYLLGFEVFYRRS